MSSSKESNNLDNLGVGDVPIPEVQNSIESLASAIFPWRGIIRNRRVPVARYETGRTVTSRGFYMCLMSILLLCTGIGLTISSIYLLIYRNPYVQITDGTFHSEAITFTLCAGVVNVLCWWIAWIAHDNKKNYVFLPLLIVILTLSLSMLLTAVGISFVQKTRMVFDKTSKPVKLTSSHYKTLLNESLNSALKLYEDNESYKNSWDRIQQRLNCCGIDGPGDYTRNNKEIPWSCYLNYKCAESKILIPEGCVDKIAYEFDWELCLLIGLSLITFCVEMITMVLICGVYIGDKVEGHQ